MRYIIPLKNEPDSEPVFQQELDEMRTANDTYRRVKRLRRKIKNRILRKVKAGAAIEDGPLGLEVVPRSGGGVYIKEWSAEELRVYSRTA